MRALNLCCDVLLRNEEWMMEIAGKSERNGEGDQFQLPLPVLMMRAVVHRQTQVDLFLVGEEEGRPFL